MKTIIPLFLLLACALPPSNSPPVAGTGCSANQECTGTTLPETTESSTTAAEPGACDAYIGCMQQCMQGDCESLCAEATGSDVDVCEQARCDGLVDACSQGVEQACSDVLSCASTTSSETSAETSSGASTETTSGTSTESTGDGSTESSSSTSGSSSESSSSSDSSSASTDSSGSST